MSTAQLRPCFNPEVYMAKKKSNEVQLLELLKKILPKATDDPKLAQKIFSAVELELKAKTRSASFKEFCERVELPDLNAATVTDVTRQLKDAFGEGDVTVRPDKKEELLEVEVDLPDGKLTTQIKVRPIGAEESDEQEIKLKFVPFPVALPGDQELVWLLAKRENLNPEEAGMSLSKVEEEFWASKTGQKLLRDRVERSFPEFIQRAPAGLLSEAGLKRHYKTPEPIHVHRTLQAPRANRGMKPEKASA
jgi:hypothetical protein